MGVVAVKRPAPPPPRAEKFDAFSRPSMQPPPAEEPEQWAKDKLHPTREWDSSVFDRYWREVRVALYHAYGALKDDDRYYGEYGCVSLVEPLISIHNLHGNAGDSA